MIHHVALEAAPADREPLAAFFALLGFARVDPPPALRDRALWLEHKDEGVRPLHLYVQVHVLFAEEPVVPPQGHVAIVAPDYEATLGRLRAAGFEPEPRTEHWGQRRCFVRAPGGHRIELMAAPPGAGA